MNFPSTVLPGAATPLAVNVTRPDFPAQGQTSPQEGVRIELSSTGGSVDVPSGTTDSGGSLHVNAKLASGSQSLTIKIVARGGQGGPILDTKTVTATSGQTSVQLTSQDSGAKALAEAAVDFGQQPVTDFQEQVAPVDTVGPFSGSASATATASNASGDRVSATAAATFEQSITTTPGTPLSLQSNGACDNSVQITAVTFPSHVFFDAESGGSIHLFFTVAGAPVHYDLSSTGNPAELRQIISQSNVVSVALGNGNGTLDPGNYDITGAAVCAVESQSYALSLTLTQ